MFAIGSLWLVTFPFMMVSLMRMFLDDDVHVSHYSAKIINDKNK